jgi:hypothetical protein
MASKREIVAFGGRLVGEGLEATCSGTVTRVSLPGDSDFAYTDYKITRISEPLPPGYYQLFVHGQVIEVQQTTHGWVSAGG